MRFLGIFLAFNLFAADKFTETLYTPWGQSFEISSMIHQEKSDYWDMMIFENPTFGKVLTMDGTVQLTEKDEAIYHEMMAHVPLLAHENPTSVLVIGGGDGGSLREVLRHSSVQKVVLVEIDQKVIDLSKKYLPFLHKGAFTDERVEIVIQDACVYVKNSPEMFDVILCDATDPIGAGAVLFTEEFYGDCKKRLKADGIFVNQNGVPFLQPEEISLTLKNRAPHFANVTYYTAAVPTYAGGIMAFGFASDKKYHPTLASLRKKLSKVGKMKYYTPEVHKASFALPQFLLDAKK